MFGLKRLFSGYSQRPAPVPPAQLAPAVVQPARPAVTGLIEQRSTRHVAGWMLDPAAPDAPPTFEAVLTAGPQETVVATSHAALGTAWLRHPPPDGRGHGYHLILPAALTDDERDRLIVRPVGGGAALPLAEQPQARYRPIKHVALDIVDNCNLRCPFCLYDYTNTHRTNVMSDEVFDAAIRLMPYVGDEFFWLSCLHEPTMHPKFTSLIERIPHEFRSNIFYTSNLSRRMPQEYYDVLGRSGLNFMNISIESRTPDIYEKMRKGAKHRIFMECWEQLLAACKAGTAPPKLRYIMMAYKSNFREIPELVAWLREERMASFIDVRYTYDMSHIDPAFKQAEYLDPPDWHWLMRELAQYSPHEVCLSLPPDLPPPPRAETGSEPAPRPTEAAEPVQAAAPAPAPAPLQPVISPGEFEFRVSYNGRAFVAPIYLANRPDIVPDLAEINILDITDPVDYLRTLSPA